MKTRHIPTLGLLANTSRPDFGNRAGGNVHFIQVARRLSDYERVAFVPDFIAAESRPLLPGTRVVAVPSLASKTDSPLLIFAFGLFSWLTRIPQLRRCDVLFATSHFLGDTLPALLVKGRSSAVIIHHIVDVPWRRPGSIITNSIAYAAEQLSLQLVKRMAGVIFVDSPSMRRTLQQMGFRQPIEVVGNAMETPVLAERPRDPNAVVYLGRLSPTKGLEDLLPAWKAVSSEAPAARLYVLGDGDDAYYQHLANLAGELGIADSVTFQRSVSDEEKWSAFTRASVFAFPSHEEGWGIVLAEAMSAGLPCVTYDLEVFREIFPDGRIAVPLRDAAAFGRALLALLADDEQRGALGRAARKVAAMYSWDEVARREQDAFERYLT